MVSPNDVQETYFRKAAGVARFAYNWALDQWQQQYDAWQADPPLPKPSEASLRRQLNAIKRNEFPGMPEVTKNAPQMAIMQLGQAFKNFFAGIAEYPTFKKKGRHDSFTLTHDQFTVKGQKVPIPKCGWVRMHESLRFVGKVLDGTIARTADRWFLSVTVEIPDPPSIRRENQAVVGVDLGVSALATLSTGEKIRGPKAYAAARRKLRQLSWSCVVPICGSKFPSKRPIHAGCEIIGVTERQVPLYSGFGCVFRVFCARLRPVGLETLSEESRAPSISSASCAPSFGNT